MTTNQRSVADVIGWTTIEDGDLWEDGRGYVRDRYAADDLLAWLGRDGNDVEMWRDSQAEDAERYQVSVVHGTWFAPTLLGALELAVRAVAGES